jgi:hypothetical protein
MRNQKKEDSHVYNKRKMTKREIGPKERNGTKRKFGSGSDKKFGVGAKFG